MENDEEDKQKKEEEKKIRLSFKKAISHIVCLNKDDCLEVEEIERCNDFLGVALSSGIGDDFYFFIVIFLDAFEYQERLLSTVIHEVAHVLDSATATTFHPEHCKGWQICPATLELSTKRGRQKRAKTTMK